MNTLLIGDSISWITNKTTVAEAIDDLFEAIVKSGLPLDVNISSFAELRNEDYDLVDEY